MKNIIILLIALLPVFSSCEEEIDTATIETNVQNAAWKSLKEHEKAKVTYSAVWPEPKIAKTTYNNVEVYSVSYPTNDMEINGPIVVLVEPNTYIVLGKIE